MLFTPPPGVSKQKIYVTQNSLGIGKHRCVLHKKNVEDAVCFEEVITGIKRSKHSGQRVPSRYLHEKLRIRAHSGLRAAALFFSDRWRKKSPIQATPRRAA